KPLRRFLLRAAVLARQEAREWKPDTVLAGSGLTAPIAWMAARTCKARTAVYVHGLDLTVPHPIYRALWRPALRRMDVIIANSRSTARLAEDIGIPQARIHVVHPGVEIPPLDPQARARFRAKHQLGDAPVLLSVGRLTARKGLREFVSDVLPRIAAARPDVQLLIVGDVPANALYAEAQTPQSIQTAADAAGVGGRVQFLGTLFGRDLADAYAGADVHVFPVRDLPNDPEGFGMVAVEAAAHGLPTAGYATGGVIDAVANGRSGTIVSPDESHALAIAILHLIERPLDQTAIHDFAAHFAWDVFGQQVVSALAGANQ
ncbi:MAG: glycosyltransferase family 4 protein, partial [Burkholderiaceae bacterium]|nr:glycosyltransferase family 4 protein [Burkholderiaceae bacterium]